jgi:hypothetical protein
MKLLADHVAELIRTVCPQEGFGVDLNALVDEVLNRLPVRKRNPNFWPSAVNSPFDCDRKQVFSRVEEIWTDSQRESPDRVRPMRLGIFQHAAVQEDLALSHRLFGNWKCPSCAVVKHTLCTLPDCFCDGTVTIRYGEGLWESNVVRSCADVQKGRHARGEAAWTYDEIRVKDDLGHSGKVDGILLMPTTFWYTLEIKTVPNTTFLEKKDKVLTRKEYPNLPKELEGVTALVAGWGSDLPKDYHVIQASIYSGLLLMLADAGDLGPLERRKYGGTIILYVNRETGRYRWFFRRNTDVEYQRARETVIKTRVAVLAAKEKPDVAARRAHIIESVEASCRTRLDRKAETCPWKTVCFPYKNATKNVVTHL